MRLWRRSPKFILHVYNDGGFASTLSHSQMSVWLKQIYVLAHIPSSFFFLSLVLYSSFTFSTPLFAIIENLCRNVQWSKYGYCVDVRKKETERVREREREQQIGKHDTPY